MLTKLIEAATAALAKLTEPVHILIALLWLSTLGVIVFLMAGCGAINYQPIEKSTLTVENQLNKEKDNEKKTDQP